MVVSWDLDGRLGWVGDAHKQLKLSIFRAVGSTQFGVRSLLDYTTDQWIGPNMRQIGHVNNIPTMHIFTGIFRNAQSKSYTLPVHRLSLLSTSPVLWPQWCGPMRALLRHQNQVYKWRYHSRSVSGNSKIMHRGILLIDAYQSIYAMCLGMHMYVFLS